MQLVDSHCHFNLLNLDLFQDGINTVLAQAKAQHVSHFLNISVDLETVQEVIQVAQTHPEIWASVGVHPSHVCSPEVTEQQLIHWAQQPKVVAIGETGLDYYHQDIPIELQKQRFRLHIRVARSLRKPLIIHTRDADEDTLAILREEKASEIGGVFHCFTRDLEVAKAALDLNFMISFSGIITFKNAQALRSCASQIPLNRILVETDSPYLAPMPFRGQPNQPAYVLYVAECLSQLHQVSLEEIAHTTTKNFFTLFSIV